MVGNKIDQFTNYEDDELVDGEEGRKFAQSINALFAEISCKENPKVFCEFIKDLIRQFNSNRQETEKDWNRISLVSNLPQKKKHKCC